MGTNEPKLCKYCKRYDTLREGAVQGTCWLDGGRVREEWSCGFHTSRKNRPRGYDEAKYLAPKFRSSAGSSA